MFILPLPDDEKGEYGVPRLESVDLDLTSRLPPAPPPPPPAAASGGQSSRMLGTGCSPRPSAPGAPPGGEVQEASGMTLTEGSGRWCSRPPCRGDDDGLKMVSPGSGCERCLTSVGPADATTADDEDPAVSAEDCGWKSGEPIPPWGYPMRGLLGDDFTTVGRACGTGRLDP